MAPAAVRTPLATLLTGRIRAKGLMTFAEFMEACLYHPEHGYYSQAGIDPARRLLYERGRSSDFRPVAGAAVP